MYESDINLEHEVFELTKGLNDLMRERMAEAAKIDEIDHKICELYALIKEKK